MTTLWTVTQIDEIDDGDVTIADVLPFVFHYRTLAAAKKACREVLDEMFAEDGEDVPEEDRGIVWDEDSKLSVEGRCEYYGTRFVLTSTTLAD